MAVTLEVNGLGIDHLKGRDGDAGQSDAPMLPAGLRIKLEPPRTVALHLKVFNEDMDPGEVRANAWVFFEVVD